MWATILSKKEPYNNLPFRHKYKTIISKCMMLNQRRKSVHNFGETDFFWGRIFAFFRRQIGHSQNLGAVPLCPPSFTPLCLKIYVEGKDASYRSLSTAAPAGKTSVQNNVHLLSNFRHWYREFPTESHRLSSNSFMLRIYKSYYYKSLTWMNLKKLSGKAIRSLCGRRIGKIRFIRPIHFQLASQKL